MHRFRFSLEPVLRLRRRQEEEAQVELARQQRRLERQKAELEQAVAALQAFETYRAALQRDAVQIAVLVEADQYGQALAETLSRRQQSVREAAAVVEAALQALHQQRVQRETLERLRERRRTEHREEELRAEQQSLDELSVLRWRK
jgi:flagellar export protein FliJ